MEQGIIEYYIEREKKAAMEYEINLFHQITSPSVLVARAHMHTSFEILYGLHGSFTVETNRGSFDFEEGDMVVFPPRCIHSIYSHDDVDGSYYVLKIPPALFLQYADSETANTFSKYYFLYDTDKIRFLWKRKDLVKSPIHPILQRLIAECKQEKTGSELAKRMTGIYLLLLLLREEEVSHPNLLNQNAEDAEKLLLIQKAVAYINLHFRENIRAEDLSRQLGMSAGYFSRCFYQVMGKNFREYLNRTRLDHAQWELQNTTRSLKEIATGCGYSTVSYFIQQYQKFKGHTPGAERAEL